MRKSIFAATMFLLVSCGNSQKSQLQAVYQFPKGLKEVSGIAYAANEIYTIEDKGNENKVSVLNASGQISRTITLQNIPNTDWEDLTFDRSGNLYIGDFGNNDNDRKDLAIYKIDKADLQNTTVTNVPKISFDYPEQTEFPPKKKNLMFDVEGFFEYQDSFYLFTKNRSKNFDGTAYIYKIPNRPGFHHAQLIGTINTCGDYLNCAITSAAISRDGTKFVLLSHSKIWLFENFKGDDFTKGKITTLPLGHYSQKEAVCFRDNETLFIADERVKKRDGNLYEVPLNAISNNP